jgi:hypothetical protein
MAERPPALLTVEEAGALLRIGRTKAYAMAREWRATGGRSGLPVVDLGSVLRVPLKALEEMTGADLTGELARIAPPSPPAPAPSAPTPVANDGARRTRPRPADQPALFDPPRAS